MELCQELHDGLQIAGDMKRISHDDFNRIFQEFKRLIDSNKNFNESNLIDSVKNGEFKMAMISILSLIIEAAKTNLTSAQLTSIIESDNHFKKDRQQVLIDFYNTNKSYFRDQLSKIRLSKNDNDLPNITDCFWRQQYLVKTSNRQKCGEINYLVKIKTDKNIQINDSNEDSEIGKELLFETSLQELQDLTSKLREAGKIIERVFKPELT